MAKQAYHGGAFFKAIGEDFSKLENYKSIINADVLDAWFSPSPKVLKKIKKYLPYIIKTSPPTHSEGLIGTISRYRNIPKENILVAGGSSDIIYTFFPCVVGKGQKVMILDPMYGEYAHILKRVIEAKLIRFRLHKNQDFIINIGKLVTAVSRYQPQMIVLVNPNSPTGQYLPKADLITFIKSVSKKTIIVVDETYIEYVGSNFSLEHEVRNFKNLVIIKSMSKVYALSGARVGYLVADREVINKLAPFIPPWSVNLIGQISAVEALKDYSYYERKYAQTHRLRNQLFINLSEISGLKVYNSAANYILVELLKKQIGAEQLVKKLKRKNVFIRNCDSMSPQFRNRFIRIAVKDSNTNKKIVKAIQGVL